MTAPSHPDPPGSSSPRRGGGADREGHLAFVAHEIRNPVSSALWTAELLARLPAAERGGDRGEKLARICLRSVERIRRLVEDHLLCERLDEGGYPLKLERIELAGVLAGLRDRWPAAGPPLELPPDPRHAVRADAALLERALEAVVAAAGAQGGPVRVEVARRGGWLELRVVGGPPGTLDDPGRGAPSDPAGRALGLPAARRAAVAMAGALSVDEEGYLLSIPAA